MKKKEKESKREGDRREEKERKRKSEGVAISKTRGEKLSVSSSSLFIHFVLFFHGRVFSLHLFFLCLLLCVFSLLFINLSLSLTFSISLSLSLSLSESICGDTSSTALLKTFQSSFLYFNLFFMYHQMSICVASEYEKGSVPMFCHRARKLLCGTHADLGL